MTENDIIRFLQTAVDGQPIRLTTASGRAFQGVYDAENTSLEDALYFESMEGNPLRAEWDKIENLEYRNPRSVSGSAGFVIPPEHPLAGTDPTTKRSYTTRNR